MNILTSPKFEELKTARQLPSAKGVARHIVKLAQKDDVTADEIVRIIKADPALAARLVKAANQGPLSGRRPVVSIPDAVVVLGLRAVRQLALGFSLLSNYPEGTCTSFDYEAYWARSLGTAVAFAALSIHIKTAPPEEAFVAGLLSRIGNVALATIYPEEYAQVLDQHETQTGTLVGLEREAFATDHNELGAALLSEWGMPRAIVDAVYHHEEPHQSGFPERSRGHLTAYGLHFAGRLGDWCFANDAQRLSMYPDLRVLARRIGLSEDAMASLLDEIAKEWRQWRPLLDADRGELSAAERPDECGDGPPAEIAQGLAVMAQAEGAGPAQKLRVLLADDDPAVLTYLKKILTAEGHQVFTAGNGQAGLAMALELNPQVIITDWLMPEMDGVTLCKALRQTSVGRSIYILVLTDFQDTSRLIEAFDAGADDYVRKPLSAKVLVARLRAAQRVLVLHEELERDREQMRRFAADLAIENRRYQQAALTDPLTGFPNRRYVMERLEQEWASAKRTGRPFACLLIDIDHFKRVNDTHGHDAGDIVLKHTAQVLRDTARVHDVISRLGGEEFLVVCPDTGTKGAQACAERLRAAVEAASISVGAIACPVTVSIGVAVWNKEIPTAEALIKAADVAVYAAKDGGRNQACYAGPGPKRGRKKAPPIAHAVALKSPLTAAQE